MNSNIILIGMPTSGKSTAGVILAKVTGRDFIDTDLLIQKRCGKKLSEIIGSEGLDAFLRIEADVCKDVEETGSVIATGGSVVYCGDAMRHLKSTGTIVYLEIDLDTLKKRLHNARKRGVVLKDGQSIEDLYAERTPLYEKYADITVSQTGLDMEETVHTILTHLGSDF